MKTNYYNVDPQYPNKNPIIQAAALISRGEIVVFPTETVYGLGANALDAEAVKKIFAAKGRPADNPLIVHVADKNWLEKVAQVNTLARELINKFWPGPLTLILPKKDIVPKEVTAGLNTVAVRMPSHPVAQLLIKAAGVPIAAPSANSSGKPSSTQGQHALDDLVGKVAMILDAGPVPIGLESTILDVSKMPPVLLRPGYITKEDLLPICKEIQDFKANFTANQKPPSPGLKYVHYAPTAPVFLAKEEGFFTIYEQLQKDYGNVAVLCSVEMLASSQKELPLFKILGSRKNLQSIAQELFAALRWCDQTEAKAVLVEIFPEEGIGLAIMDRLKRAAVVKG